MADNVLINTGTGATVATDDDGTAQVQWIKIQFGGDGSFTAVSTASGLPVQILSLPALTAAKATVTNAGTFAVQITSLPAFAATASVNITSLPDLAIGTSLLVTTTNAGTFAVQVTSFPDFATTASVKVSSLPALTAASATVTNAGTFAVQITSLPDFAIGTSILSTVTNAGTFAIQVTSLPAFATTASVRISSLPAFAVGALTSISNGAILSISNGAIKIEYATSSPLTITLANLSNATARESNAIDNSTNKFLDAMVYVQVGIGQTTGTDLAVYLYTYGSEDGTNYTYPATGADAVIVTTPTNLTLLKVISTQVPPFTDTNFKTVIGSVATAFNGILPRKWGIVVDNRSGGSLVNTAANHSVSYTGVYATK